MKIVWLLIGVVYWLPSIAIARATQETRTQFNLSSTDVGSLAQVNAAGNVFNKSNTFKFVKSNPPGTLIVGGVVARRNEFPWLVYLEIDGGTCGGSLISLDTVLTAAHCLVIDSRIVDPAKVLVLAGAHNLLEVDFNQQLAIAVHVIIHEEYDTETFANDIALIKLNRNFTVSTAVLPIALPYRNEDVVGNSTTGTAAGWGVTTEGGQTISTVLMKVQVPLVTDQTCTSEMSYSAGQFCAGTSGQDSCQGDSGGPFLCNSKPTVVCGIVSYGEGCGRPNKPGVYTKVSSYITWIGRYVDFLPEEPTTTTPQPSNSTITTPQPSNSTITTTKASQTTTSSSSSLLIYPFSSAFLFLTMPTMFYGVFQIIF